jgi:hypothetical protein
MKVMYGLACRGMFLTNRNPNFVVTLSMESSKIASRNTCLLPVPSDLSLFSLTCDIQYRAHSLRYAIRSRWLHKSCNQVQGYFIAKNRLCMLEILFQQPPAFLCTSIMFIALRYPYYNTRCITPHLHIYHTFPTPSMYTQETFQITVYKVS